MPKAASPVKDFTKQCLTGIDGESYDVGRVLWAIVGIGFVILTAYSVFKGAPFDPQSYGIGAGGILGGGGAGVALKAKTEPAA